MIPDVAELVRQALAGSQPAYQALVGRYAAAAVNLAARMVHDRALAEDLAQEAFLRAFERLSSYDPSRRFAPWFFQILHNVTIDHLRHKQPATVSLDELQSAGVTGFAVAGGGGPDVWAEQAAKTRAIDSALARIRPEYREAIVLHYREELSVEEVAQVMQVPVGSVKTYLHRGRKEIASMLLAMGWESETAHGKVP